VEQSQVHKKDRLNEQKEAKEFALSSRGQLVVAQALSLASKILADKEPSNSQDMTYIGSNLFEPYWTIYNSDEFAKAVAKVEKDCMEHNERMQKIKFQEMKESLAKGSK